MLANATCLLSTIQKTQNSHEKSHQEQFHRYGACVNVLYARGEKA